MVALYVSNAWFWSPANSFWGDKMINKIVLIGRLAQDPELRYTQGDGVAVVNFTIAVNRPFANQKGEREADFIRIVAWRKQAETCATYLAKGRLVAVEGRLQIRSYEDKEGNKRSIAEVVANSVQFLERKDAADSAEEYEPFQDERMDVKNEDVPF